MDDRANQRTPLALSGEKPPPLAKCVPVDPNASLEERIVAALHTIYNPEIPVDIYELGLIYDLKVDPSGAVAIRMTLTSPMCPVAERADRGEVEGGGGTGRRVGEGGTGVGPAVGQR